MKRYCFTLDLVDDAGLIEEYKYHHRNFWPELREHTKNSGIRNLELYNIGNRLFMLWETEDNFRLEEKNADIDSRIAKLSSEWEELMSKYQVPLSMAEPGDKWVLMEKIFEL